MGFSKLLSDFTYLIYSMTYLNFIQVIFYVEYDFNVKNIKIQCFLGFFSISKKWPFLGLFRFFGPNDFKISQICMFRGTIRISFFEAIEIENPWPSMQNDVNGTLSTRASIYFTYILLYISIKDTGSRRLDMRVTFHHIYIWFTWFEKFFLNS